MSDELPMTVEEDWKESLTKLAASPEFQALIQRVKGLGQSFPELRDVPQAPASLQGKANFWVGVTLHGVFIGLWSEFELMIEVLIMQITGLTEVNTAILCTPMPIGHKVSVITSLLNEHRKDAKGCDLIRAVSNAASRNMFVHGFWTMDDEQKNIMLYQREVKNTFSIKSRNKNWGDHANHILDCVDAYRQVQGHFRIEDSVVRDYKNFLLSFAQN